MFSSETKNDGISKKWIEIIQKKLIDGKMIYEKMTQDEFDALILLLQENYPIVSLTFSYKKQSRFHGYSPSYILYTEGSNALYANEQVCVNALSAENLTRLLNVLLTSNTVTYLTFIGSNSENWYDPPSNTIPADLVAKLLVTNCTITELKFSSYSWSQDTEIEVIANALLANQSLNKLELSNASIKDKGATMLANMLLTNKTITDLNLEGNNISRDVLELIEKRLKQNKESIDRIRLSSLAFSQKASSIADLKQPIVLQTSESVIKTTEDKKTEKSQNTH